MRDAVYYKHFPEGKGDGSVPLVQEPLRIQRCHAAKAGGGDGLAIHLVGHITCGEHAGDAGLGGVAFQAGLDLQVAISHLQLAFEQRSIG